MKLHLALVFLTLPSACPASHARTIHLTDADIAPVRVVLGRSTVLNFPLRPSKVVLGNQGSFTVEFVENDLAVAALRAPASGNLFVYMEGRRFAFDLRTVQAGGDEIVVVRDAAEPKPRKRRRGKHE